MIKAKRQFLLIAVVATLSMPFQNSFAQSGNGAGAGSNSGTNPHAISLYNLGLSAYRQGSPESAIIFFKRAVDLDPDLADAQYNLGVLYQSERRLKEAVPRFKEALRVRPDDADSHYQLALAYIDLNQLSDAKEQLMTIAPNNSHFGDAQKKIAAIDSGSANTASNGVTAINTPVQNSTVQSMANATTATVVQPNAGTTSIATDSAVAPSMTNPSNNISPPVVEAATGAPVAAPATSINPVALIDNTSVQVVANGFAAPSGLTFDKLGNLYIANFVNNTIDRLSPDGKKTQFSSGINLKGPIGLISDDDNNIFVANYLAGTVTRINPAGIAQVIVSGLKKPYYLARDKEGNLFVSQQEDNTIVRISFSHASAATGNISQQIP